MTNILLLFSGTFKVKLPSKSAVVPMLVALITTLAPGNGSPPLSFTVPFMYLGFSTYGFRGKLFKVTKPRHPARAREHHDITHEVI